jgi:hypothetical protein
MIHCAIGIEKTHCVLVLVAFAIKAFSRTFQQLGAFCASLQIEKTPSVLKLVTAPLGIFSNSLLTPLPITV